MKRGKAQKLREMIVQASESLTDEDALESVELFPAWQPEADYVKGQRVQRHGLLYRLIPETHHSQADWPPELTPAIWARVLIPDPTQIPDWELPDSTNPYAKGDRVRHRGSIWVSDLDGNVWEPGVYGWTKVQE